MNIRSTRLRTVSLNTRLSSVVEVGLSESAQQLALDAHGWLETHSSSMKLVATISTNAKSPRSSCADGNLFLVDMASSQGHPLLQRVVLHRSSYFEQITRHLLLGNPT